ncbi:Tumor necrosis factor receptor superfamily member 1A precursor [Salmo salar]|uniref:Tumor necrosis factor receptor superfamily member 1A n=1 Tax=Salmo salar TaxID=8030 RepID=B5X3D9_SALSA|nr:Tumor necrosis factor receptor superfamily member 1A precursor [Salmo salar]ACI33820.1 Tumor necrosis factor receptor superfamily member 1A precursor [Salmo salar]|eukprot:NP_001135245.1 Tumor necrosis factor receptor superfamily member 1A precursor [Salmo salar]
MDVLRGKWKEKCILNVCALLVLCWSVDPYLLAPPPEGSQCPDGSHYHNANGTCCRKCHEGFKLKEHCTKDGENSQCVPCEEGRTYREKSNYVKTCLRCTLCVDNEEEESPCKKSSNTLCRCKKGFYKNRINSETRECLSCKTCGPGERETQPCTQESDTVCECKDFYFRDKKNNKTCLPCQICELTADCQQECSSGTHPTPNGVAKPEDTGWDVWSPYLLALSVCVCVLLLVVVGIMGVLVVRRKPKGSSSFPSAEITSQGSETSTRRLIQEDPENVLNQSIPSYSPVCESEQEPLSTLPDCVPKEIKISELIYSVLDQVPPRHVKELVRSLGVSDIVIERAENDHLRDTKEAQYQMLRVWAKGNAQGGGEVLARPLLYHLLDKLRDMDLGGTAEELETKYRDQ